MAHPPPHPASVTVPVIEETVEVGSTVEQTGAVRTRLEVHEHLEAVELHRSADEVTVERVRVDRPVAQRQAAWTEGDVLVVPVYEEVPVVTRQLVLTEEIRLHRRRVTTVDTAQVPLRKERAVVERQAADGTWQPVDTPARRLGERGEQEAAPPGPRSGSTSTANDRSDS